MHTCALTFRVVKFKRNDRPCNYFVTSHRRFVAKPFLNARKMISLLETYKTPGVVYRRVIYQHVYVSVSRRSATTSLKKKKNVTCLRRYVKKVSRHG